MFIKLNRKLRDEEGFTLIELMVVVLIIGILIAIALPTFLGARKRAQDRAAQSDLRNGLATAKTYFTDGDTYVAFDTGCGAGADSCTTANTTEPSLDWRGTATNGSDVVAVTAATATEVVLTAISKSGKEFCIADSTTLGTTRRSSPAAGAAAVTTYALCLAQPGTW
jgi:type IV pilus assembly protein PilA